MTGERYNCYCCGCDLLQFGSMEHVILLLLGSGDITVATNHVSSRCQFGTNNTVSAVDEFTTSYVFSGEIN